MLRNGARKPDEPEIVGASESAEILGVAQANLRVVRGLPEPYVKLRSTTLYRADEMRMLAAKRNARIAADAIKAKANRDEAAKAEAERAQNSNNGGSGQLPPVPSTAQTTD